MCCGRKQPLSSSDVAEDPGRRDFDVTPLAERVLRGEVPAIARMITRVESGAQGVDQDLAELYRAGGNALVVGVTGAPGTGKSTLVSAMTREVRARGKTVGIIAVDPTSPYTGGAIMGDRIRMSGLSGDDGVFIRSMATRGALGGLARAAVDAVAVLDAAGRDWVIVETVGVGQDEVDIARASHATLVISVPGLGDDIQAIKAGVLEIADLHVVNKADRDGAHRTAMELKTMLNLAGPRVKGSWKPPVLLTIAERGEGVAELVEGVERFAAWQRSSGRLAERERDMAAARLRAIATGILLDHLEHPEMAADFDSTVERVRARRIDPFTAARELIGGVATR
jgi:LAO/AO transport system kinase